MWYPLWILAALAQRERNPEVEQQISEAGSGSVEDSLTFVAAATEYLREANASYAGTAFSSLAEKAFQVTLSEVLSTERRGLFEADSSDLERGLSDLGRPKVFGTTVAKYLSTFYANCLTYFLSFEISSQVGPKKRFASLDEANEFRDALFTYATDVSSLVKPFAEEWFSKGRWERGEINQDDVRRFAFVALRKLRTQIERETK